MLIKPLVIALTLTLGASALAQNSKLILAEANPVTNNLQQLEGKWVYTNCGESRTSKSASEHAFSKGDEFTLSISEIGGNRVNVQNKHWTMIEMPVLNAKGKSITADGGIAIIDGHQHMISFKLVDQTTCLGSPSYERTIRIDYSDISNSHGDAARHGGSFHDHGVSGG